MIIVCVAMLLHNPIGLKEQRQKFLFIKDSAELPTALIDTR